MLFKLNFRQEGLSLFDLVACSRNRPSALFTHNFSERLFKQSKHMNIITYTV